MPSLRSLLSDLSPPSIGNPNRVFFVRHTGKGTQNGGCGYSWTVPAGITKATFELWGAGGDGPGARCCERAGVMPTSGSYAIKTVDTAEGCVFCICSGGSGCCGCCCGITSQAFPSYVIDVSGGGSTIACAPGGTGGCIQMSRGQHCAGQACCWGILSSCGLGDVVMPGGGGTILNNNFCRQALITYRNSGAQTGRWTNDQCTQMSRTGENLDPSCASWPSGSGMHTGASGGGYFYGTHDQGGFVQVTYT